MVLPKKNAEQGQIFPSTCGLISTHLRANDQNIIYPVTRNLREFISSAAHAERNVSVKLLGSYLKESRNIILPTCLGERSIASMHSSIVQHVVDTGHRVNINEAF